MSDESELKIAINNFVWMHAPGEITLRAADELACKVLTLFLESRTEIYGAPAMPYERGDELPL